MKGAGLSKVMLYNLLALQKPIDIIQKIFTEAEENKTG